MLLRGSEAENDYRLDLFLKLTDHQLRSSYEFQEGVCIAESIKVVRTALAQGVQPIAFLMEERRLARMQDVLDTLDPSIPVFVLSRERISQIVGFPHNRGVLCAMKRPHQSCIETVLHGASCIAVLEAITDTTNVGAIFRSAAALGVKGMLLSPTCADPLCRRAIRVSMGTVFSLPWARIPHWPEGGCRLLHDKGFSIIACALSESAVELSDPHIHEWGNVALLFGTEGDGLSHKTIMKADHVVRIPMAPDVDSLNVAAASAVFFWEFGKSRTHASFIPQDE